MRVYGRTRDVLSGKKTWWLVRTDINGFNDSVYLTALAQVIKLNLGESPFFANYGIPAHASVITQIYPDFWINNIQQQYAPFFASLLLAIVPIPQGDPASDDGRPVPAYRFEVLTNYGAEFGITIAKDYPLEQPI